MSLLILLYVTLFSSINHALLSRRSVCQHKKGLPCYSKEMLMPGSSYTITSKTCDNRKYMKNENCVWYFDVEGCTPSIHCDGLDIRGRGKESCRQDTLKIETENGQTSFCGKSNKKRSFTEEQKTAFFDVVFNTNSWNEGSGFLCTVSCSEEPIGTLQPPAACQCGLPNRVKRIVGGVKTEMNEYPWMVGLLDPDGDFPFCGGAILSSRTIITAAHCVQGSSVNSFAVVVGEHGVSVDDGQERFRVCKKVDHPKYQSRTSDYDFAILTLCNPITFRREASPVCLPTQPGSAYDSVVSTVSGWGTLDYGGYQPDILMEANVTTMTNTECNEDYDGEVLDSMICAKGNEKDACQGDSGGPLITKEPGNFYSLIGVVSWGIGCADPNHPGVYARVTEVLNWIQKNIRGTVCMPPNI